MYFDPSARPPICFYQHSVAFQMSAADDVNGLQHDELLREVHVGDTRCFLQWALAQRGYSVPTLVVLFVRCTSANALLTIWMPQ